MTFSIQTLSFHLAGQVQGVGMRFTLKRWAKKLDLTGYVLNEKDGTVSGIIQGSEPAIKTFQAWLNENPPGRIDRILFTPLTENKTWTRFSIEHTPH